MIAGCKVPSADVSLPDDAIFERDQLVIHSDFYIPSKHRLIDQLAARRGDIATQLKLPLSNEPIKLFVFRTEEKFREYMNKEHPEFPNRRAFFLKNDTDLKIFAFWGERVGEDLRHEVTHGYLHSVVFNVPLWLDEGIAEFYETPRGKHGLHSSHIYLLNAAFKRGDWNPDLVKLEQLSSPEEMSQMDYAESWLWVHYLLEGDDASHSKLLQDQLARLRMSAESEPLSKFIDEEIESKELALAEHLKRLAEKL